MQKTRIIFKASIARKLLKMGFTIVDLKPQKSESGSMDFTRCIFVFKDENNIECAIKDLIKK